MPEWFLFASIPLLAINLIYEVVTEEGFFELLTELLPRGDGACPLPYLGLHVPPP